MSKGNDGRSLVVWLLICGLLGFALWWFELRSPRKHVTPAHPTPGDAGTADASRGPTTDALVETATGPTADAANAPADAAPAPAIEEIVGERQPVIPQDLSVRSISLDGTSVLLDGETAEHDKTRLRVLSLATGKVETDLVLGALDGEWALDGPNALTELASSRTILSRFPLGESFSIAASPDGLHSAANRGDPLHVFWNGKVGPSLKKPAGYQPIFAPDGKTFLFRGYDGRLDEEGKYSLFMMPVGGKNVAKVAGTDGYDSLHALTAAGTLRIIVAHPPKIPPCVVEVALTAPIRVLGKHCPEDADRLDIRLSPRGASAAWFSGADSHRRLRVMDLATGNVVTDVADLGWDLMSVSDEGRVLVGHQLFERGGTTPRTILADASCLFMTNDELVCERNGGLVRFVIGR